MKAPGGSLDLSFLELLLLILEGVELIVLSVEGQQLLVIALLHNLSVGQENDVVCVLDGGKPMGNDQHGADGPHFLQRVLNEHLCLGVDS